METSNIIASASLLLSIVNFIIIQYQRKHDLDSDLNQLSIARENMNNLNDDNISPDQYCIDYNRLKDKYLASVEKLCNRYTYHTLKKHISFDLSFIAKNKIVDCRNVDEPWSQIKKAVNKMKAQ